MTGTDTAAQLKTLNRRLHLANQTLATAKGPSRVPAALERVQAIQAELTALGAQPTRPRGTVRQVWAIPSAK